MKVASIKQKDSNDMTAGKANRLADETSPYLLQHAHNPVDWYPWGQEAFEQARQENKPILLSIGYSACHWCHVMEHESFKNENIAQMMNENFVNIKVDREERPDIDEIYMKAVQLMTGHGGWPMTVFLTPDVKPFFGGTYFPPDDSHCMPGFNRVLASIAAAWKGNREQIDDSSEELVKYLSQFDKILPSGVELDQKPIELTIDHILQTFDHQWGGFGTAPKFPLPSNLTLAMRCLKSRSSIMERKHDELLQLVTTTLDKMAYGGMHDQLGGGFARYSVDRAWLVPHFEKMLYDNATLSKAYFEGYLLTGQTYWRNVGKNCLDFVSRELSTPEGAFYSSLDADSEGEEGKFYVWTPQEIISTLGESDGCWVSEIYGVTDAGNFEHATCVLHLTDSPEVLSKRFGVSTDEFWQRLNPLKQKLFAERAKRIHPRRDEKVLTSWNSLMISGFIAGYKVLQDKQYLNKAKDAVTFLLTKLQVNGRLLRTYGQGKAKLNAYLDDYSYLVQALLDLCEVDCNPRWYENAIALTDTMLEHFWDKEHGSFFYTSNDHETLLTRLKNYFDGSTPSGTSVAVMDLLRLSRLSGNSIYRERANQALKLLAPQVVKGPDQFANLMCALDFGMSPGIEIAIIIDSSQSNWHELLKTVHRIYIPNSVTLLKDIEHATASSDAYALRQDSVKGISESPLFESRGLISGKSTAYICHNFTCEEPITDPAILLDKLQEIAN